jgi:Family of unknown function (DUF5995)
MAASGETPNSVPEVVGRMRAIEGSLPQSDGVACFVSLYRQVTEDVNRALDKSAFANPRFLERLDVAFANLFFSAYDVSEGDPRRVPRAWTPVFAARSRRDIAPIQFAFAGMNAHINRDLPVALVTTWGELGIEPRSDSPEHADFLRVNALLADVEAKLKDRYTTGWLGRLDRVFGRFHRLDDVIAMWDIERARDAAWTNGETLWALRDEPQLADEYLDSLDRMVGFAGRGLLVPSNSLLGRAAGRLRGLWPFS